MDSKDVGTSIEGYLVDVAAYRKDAKERLIHIENKVDALKDTARLKNIEGKINRLLDLNKELDNRPAPGGREILISYSQNFDLEDVVLYDVLREESEIFYIDVGSNDPFRKSVTKLLYDMKNAHGINIDPLASMIDASRKERPRDVNICAGVGEKDGEMEVFENGTLTTFLPENAQGRKAGGRVPIMTLAKICNTYCKDKCSGGGDIHFLKIDAEGMERQVLASMDFKTFRPWIVLVESTRPCSNIPNYEEWESILLQQGYSFVIMIGVNRYYVAEEKKKLSERFLPKEELRKKYQILHAVLRMD